jgi:hypothetical protein
MLIFIILAIKEVKMMAEVSGIVWVMSIALSAVHHTTKYLTNLVELDDVMKKFREAIKDPPKVNHSISCYHMEWKTYKDSKGTSHTKKVRKETFQESIDFKFE